MRAAALALLLAVPASGQERTVLEVRSGYIDTPDAGTVQVRGGAYLDGPTLLSTGRELAQLRAENQALKAAPVATPPSLAVAVITGIAVGLAGGAALVLWVRR